MSEIGNKKGIDFHEANPADALKALSSFTCVFLVVQPFLHSKIYEFHFDSNVVSYHGSVNLTDGGISQNFECMSKDIHIESTVGDF
ncbi:phospholipase D family protein [Niallia taxi]|nr:phospholipase D family protein [Niallia taxi]MDE5052473.1 phospholipase D family protein [Niallia taxi]